MKFTPTSFFLSLCNGASKLLQWKVYVKKTTDLSEALTSGTWVEVTDRVVIPTVSMAIEANVGSSTSDKITLVGDGIAWWLAQVFNATASQYIEVKVTCQLGLSETKLATDLCYEFYGYAEKQYTITESTDQISFGVYSADDLLGMLPAENLSKQVKVADLDGAGLEGLYLQTIPGVYVVDVDISSYELHQGVHTIKFGFRSGLAELTLDDGDAVQASAGLVVLKDDGDTERAQVWCTTAQFGPADAETEIIVMATGQTLPWTWISGIRVKDALAQIYAFIGLTSFTFDEWDLDTYDGRRVTSFFEVPPSSSYYGRTNCLAYDDGTTKLYLGVKDRLYTRNMSTHTYTLLCTPSAGWNIKKIFTDRIAGDGYLWLWLQSGTSNKIARITVSDNTVSAYAVTSAYEQAVCYASGIGASGSLLYWAKSGSYVKAFDLATPAESDLNDGAAFSLIDYVVDQSGGCTDGSIYYTIGYQTAAPHDLYLISVAAGGETLLHILAYTSLELGCYGNFIIFSYTGLDGCNVYTIPTDTLTLAVATGEVVAPFTRSTTVHFVRRVGDDLFVAKWNGSNIISETESIRFATDTIDVGQLMTYDTANSKNLFVAYVGSMLGQFYSKVSVFISAEVSFAGENLRGALNSILESYMMIGKITADKKVKVYRRFNASGAVVTSGSSFAITINAAEDIIKSVRYSEAVKWLEVSNGTETHSYDGTNWDEKLFTAERKLTVNSKLIPSNIVKDVCYYLWQFFSVDHDLYELPLANVTPLHLEAFDGLAVTFTGNRITESGTLVIYGISVDQDGYMKIKALK